MNDDIIIQPRLAEPFPDIPDLWKDRSTGLRIPKKTLPNIEYRSRLLKSAENDLILQNDLMEASSQSILFWINTFVWTYHQFDVDVTTGKRIPAKNTNVPFITWDIQDNLFNEFQWCLRNAEDILLDKARDMGASWCCVAFLHWLWLFRKESCQLLEMSRTEPYVDLAGNMKALFQKHDYINKWLPEWMVPPKCMPGEKHRTKMHMKNAITGSVIDGESTTENAASGDRRLVALLDEFSKVEHGQLMRSSTRDAALMRIINSTVAGAGTEYSNWKNSGKIKVFIMPYWEHPDKGRGRYLKLNDRKEWEIRSPWFDIESKIRSPKELAREVLRQDVESGEMFFTPINVDKHIILFGCEPKSRMNVRFKKGMDEEKVRIAISKKDFSSVEARKAGDGPLRIWTNLINGRPDQSKRYIFGIDVSKGQGASNSVISIKCKETGEKIAEWRDANMPPYEFVYVAAALAIWCGGAKPMGIPFVKWENNGPGWDFGRFMAKKFNYPYYYRRVIPGKIADKKTESYGFHTDPQSKFELLSLYDRVLAHGGYINHCIFSLNEAKQYIYFSDGSIGPASLVEENPAARKTHGDTVMADALTLDDSDLPAIKYNPDDIPKNSFGARYLATMKRKNKKTYSYQKKFDFSVRG
ncbi:MAG: hypothetical protein IMZ53_02875 [Thermoplasmata archaeon]|nr:hypothetical protein [Thermoplasmata archaeon]